MNQKNNVLIILGMHRSGTSLIAQWLHRCGLHLGDRLIKASIGNEKGHYEDLDFHDLHEKIFRANRVSYGGLTKVPQLSINKHQKDKLELLIKYKNNLNTTWGWKDPRTCLFLDIYENIIKDPTYLIVYREANEVVNSLLKRREKMFLNGYYISKIVDHLKYQISKKTNYKFSTRAFERNYTASWIQYNEKILDLIKKIDKHRYKVIEYKSLLHNSPRIISWLNKRDFKLKNVPFEEVFDCNMISSLDPKINIDMDFKDTVKNIEHQYFTISKKNT